jgi:hypothetical protein
MRLEKQKNFKRVDAGERRRLIKKALSYKDITRNGVAKLSKYSL